MNTIQALAWNRKTYRFDVKGEIQVQTRKNKSADAKHKGELARNSDKVPFIYHYAGLPHYLVWRQTQRSLPNEWLT